MGQDHLSPQNDGPGNEAYQRMQEALANVTERERGRRRGDH